MQTKIEIKVVKHPVSNSNCAFVNSSVFNVGESVKAFDSEACRKSGDVGNNSQFYREATIIAIRENKSLFGGVDYVADIRWNHNGQTSCGHFVSGLIR